jgi:hypothetical protein
VGGGGGWRICKREGNRKLFLDASQISSFLAKKISTYIYKCTRFVYRGVWITDRALDGRLDRFSGNGRIIFEFLDKANVGYVQRIKCWKALLRFKGENLDYFIGGLMFSVCNSRSRWSLINCEPVECPFVL